MARSSDRRLRSGRDWANMDVGPAGLVAEHVLRNDLVDLVRFRAVCRAWRACSAHLRPQGVLDRRFLPRRWIMLPRVLNNDKGHHRRLFVNVFTGESIRRVLPAWDCQRYHVLATTSEGFVLRLSTDVGQLLNPLTGEVAGLPSATSLRESMQSLHSLKLRGAGLAADDTVVLHIGWFSLAVAKPGDERWTHIHSHDRITSILPFAGRVYCATSRNISVVQTRTMANQPPQLLVAADHKLHEGFGLLDDFKNIQSRWRCQMFLVENNGELILCLCVRGKHTIPMESDVSVYRMDLDAKNIVPLHGIDGRVLFLGKKIRSLLVPTGVSPNINADTAYLCWSKPRYGGATYGIDLFSGERTKPRFKDDDVAYYLSCYVTEYYSEGIHASF
ncbi:hypothetical protein VPH35_118576 [Triticum aestivum]